MSFGFLQILTRNFRCYCIVSLLAIIVSHYETSSAHVVARETQTVAATAPSNTESELEVETTTLAAIKLVDNDNEVSLFRGAWNWIMSYMRTTLNTVDVEELTNESLAELTSSLTTDDADEADEAAGVQAKRFTRSVAEGRTFGKIRRLQMALIPIVFKFGVLSAMVAFLVLLGMKTLFLLKLLVIMNAVAIVGKFLTFKSGLWPSGGHSEHHVASYGWSPYMQQGWGPTLPVGQQVPPQSKEIHLHLHGLQAQPYATNEHNYAYGSGPSSSWNRRSNDPYSAAEYNNYSVNMPLEVHSEKVALDEPNSVDNYNQNYLPQNHRNF